MNTGISNKFFDREETYKRLLHYQIYEAQVQEELRDLRTNDPTNPKLSWVSSEYLGVRKEIRYCTFIVTLPLIPKKKHLTQLHNMIVDEEFLMLRSIEKEGGDVSFPIWVSKLQAMRALYEWLGG